ncbi:MAG: hypothetical protein M1837_006945 [Sclerophora amabilis]|nr:MAG: hypothetical protein M1837_006945 [Sclerophora amabilis]
MSNLQTLLESDIDEEKFRGLFSSIRRGGVVSVTGIPHRTRRGELTILSAELPKSLAPGLQLLPTELLDPETRIRNRHVDLLVNQQTADTLRLRSEVVQCVRDFLLRDDFLEVQTPILADGAGGAVARPFSTSATEFPEKHVNLRIAPELWLKRLILGGLDRVFEIGPSFRNEGLDLTHNPEFTTCEFYKSYADLEELVGMTETLLSALSHHVQSLKSQKFTSLSPLSIDFTPPFKRLSFIPVLESAISLTLPDLSSPSAFSSLLSIFESLSIPVPSRPTLPRLLDKLATVYLEPQCESAPTFITHHPECLAPLSKSFFDPVTEQRVSARVELFVQGRELINAYEEENSPFEQRRKFVEQLQYKGHDEDEGMSVDESYLEALEWGLPPTGGWGCGIDRLVMLFSGAKRIGDVLSFGSLKNVVGLAGATRMKRGELEDNETEEGRNI